MNIQSVARMMALYTVIVGGVTVGGVYALSHSGLYIVLVAAAGLFLVGIGGGSVGAVSASTAGGTEEAEMSQMMDRNLGVAHATKGLGARLALILYGIGLVFWSVVVLTFFRSGLQ